MIPIIMLAGHNTDDKSIDSKLIEFYKGFNVHYLEGIPKGRDIIVEGRPLIQHEYEKYDNIAKKISGRVYVAGPKDIYSGLVPEESIIDTNEGPLDNLINALKNIKENEKVIVTTIDIPLADEDMTRKYIDKALGSEADAVVQMVKKDWFNALKLDYDKPGYFLEGKERYIMGHIEVLNTGNIDMDLVYRIANTLNDIKGMSMLRKVNRLLKDFHHDVPIGTALDSVFKYFTKRMTIDYAEDTLGNILGGNVKVLLSDPQFSADIDTFEEIESMKKYLNIRLRDEAMTYQNKRFSRLGISIYTP